MVKALTPNSTVNIEVFWNPATLSTNVQELQRCEMNHRNVSAESSSPSDWLHKSRLGKPAN